MNETRLENRRYGAGILVSANFTKCTDFMVSMRNVVKCQEHLASYAFGDNHYRLYKRGKNRCPRCGVKL